MKEETQTNATLWEDVLMQRALKIFVIFPSNRTDQKTVIEGMTNILELRDDAQGS